MQHETASELVSANDNRQAVYAFLARIYAKELTPETLKELEEKRSLWTKLAEAPEVRGTGLADGFKEIADYVLTFKGKDPKDILLELAAEYAGLFLGVRQMPPHPSESVYYGKERLIMQRPRDEVLKIYRSMGLEKVGKFTEPEDHIAIELQFMAHLSSKTSDALKSNNSAEARRYLEVQRDFLNEHLAKWVPMLVADILKGARREFYKSVAKITDGYVKIDREVVLEMIDSLPSPVSSGTGSKI